MTICGWCGKVTDKEEPKGMVSHGICPECFKEISTTLDEIEKKTKRAA